MAFTLRELAELVQGELLGEGNPPIENARILSEAGAGEITLITSTKQYHLWESSPASAAVVPLGTILPGRPLIAVADPLTAFGTLVLHFRGPQQVPADEPEIDATAHIHPSASIGAGCQIGPYAVIGAGAKLGDRSVVMAHSVIGPRCQLGEDVTIYPQVVLYADTLLGHRVIIHSHSVIGSDGFGYRTKGGQHIRVPHLGNVTIGDDVEIGACSTIDRGTFGSTRIGSGTKIDNLVQIGHNCQIGEHNLFAGQAGLSGSVTTGAYVVLGGQVGIADHVVIGEQAMVGARSGTASNLEAGKRYLGAPALPVELQTRVMTCLARLPDIRRDVGRIKKQLGLSEQDS